ncbi:probable high-affinity nitrate transporter-activating protein 2.2 [Aegilops tauschii subsp. strangulata]|uniref:probable high-affinity nitrate transporter-activating protein 2.2 n=1 Tax=Aegilops tauschii subsp. strangulata TaxID=200361 RepID=UPI000989BD43|nr:high-affinity nitrate transporter-activating protein 2.1-like [Aegilops tauschii subsp. strangulata]
MARSELVMALLVVVLAAVCCASAGAVAYLSKLPVTLDVTASPSPGQGATIISYVYALFLTRMKKYSNSKSNQNYAPLSQREHESRKTHENLDKDKTCQYKVTEQPYTGAGGKVEYRVALDIPTATYYVRAYALDASGTQVAYGQTLRTATFNIVSIRGINTSIKVASGVFSTFSAVSLVFFFFIL